MGWKDTIKPETPRVFRINRSEDSSVAYKARFLLYFCITCIISLAIITIYTFIIQIAQGRDIFILANPIVISEICGLFVFLTVLFLLVRGYFAVSSNLMIAAGIAVTWAVIFLDRSGWVGRLDSIVFIFAVLSMTPLIILRHSFTVIFYNLINIPILLIFLITQRDRLALSPTDFYDYLFDVSIALVITCIATYNTYRTNRRALDDMMSDVDRLRDTENALRKSEELYRGLFSSLREGFVLCRILRGDDGEPVDVRCVEVNPTIERMTSKPREMFTGHSIKELFPEMNISYENRLFPVGLTGIPMKYEWTSMKTGRHYETNMFSPGKDLVAMLVTDITERKNSESEIRSLLRFQNEMLETAAIWIDTLDRDGNVISWNKAAERISGYTKEEVIGHSGIWEWLYPDSEYRSEIVARAESIISSGERVEDFQTTIRARSGEDRIISWYSNNLLNEKGEPAGSIALGVDVTEQNRARDEKYSMEQQMRQMQKMESIGRLAGGIAHDFNNILTAILGTADLALLKVNPADPMYQKFVTIKKAGETAANLTRQLLAFSRKQIIEPRVLDLGEMMERLKGMLGRMIGENIELKTYHIGNNAMIKADAGQIEQVFMNLAVNARDAMPEGGILILEISSITLDHEYCRHHPYVAQGEYIMLTISDSGVGMTRDVQEHLFEPFFTTKEAGKGTGLGLATVYGIVKQSGGSIECYSEPGHGTTFRIYFPCAAGHAGPAESMAANDEVPGGDETILVVEDSIHVLEFVQSVLVQMGYRVLTASDGEEALRISGEYDGTIHLMMTDVILTGINGRILGDRIKEHRPWIKILYNSGYSGDLISRSGILEEGILFISKPFSAMDIARKVREILDRV